MKTTSLWDLLFQRYLVGPCGGQGLQTCGGGIRSAMELNVLKRWSTPSQRGCVRPMGEAVPFSKLDSRSQRREWHNGNYFCANMAERDISASLHVQAPPHTLQEHFCQGKGHFYPKLEPQVGWEQQPYPFVSINLIPRSHANVMQACIHLVFRP